MTTTTLPDRIREPLIEVPKHLLEELEQIVEHAEAEPELVHFYHFSPAPVSGTTLTTPRHRRWSRWCGGKVKPVKPAIAGGCRRLPRTCTRSGCWS